jgi:hypothetical protein
LFVGAFYRFLRLPAKEHNVAAELLRAPYLSDGQTAPAMHCCFNFLRRLIDRNAASRTALSAARFEGFARRPFSSAEEMNARVSANCLRNQQQVRGHSKRGSPLVRGLRVNVIWASRQKVVIQAEE